MFTCVDCVSCLFLVTVTSLSELFFLSLRIKTGDISTLDGTPLKLVDKFTYLGSSVSSTEKDTDTQLTKSWTAIDRLLIIWKSDLTGKMKLRFILPVLDANKTAEKEARRQLHKNAESNIEQVLAPTPHKAATIRPPASHHENYPI